MNHRQIAQACQAAKRYARLVYYHDHKAGCGYDNRPHSAWLQFMRQFHHLPRGVVITSIIQRQYAIEMRRLVDDAIARRDRVQGKSAATP